MLNVKALTVMLGAAIIMFAPQAFADDDFVVAFGDAGGVGVQAGTLKAGQGVAKPNSTHKGVVVGANAKLDQASKEKGAKIVAGVTALEPVLGSDLPSSQRVASRSDVQSIPECFDGVREQEWCQFVPPPPATPGEPPPAFTPPTRDQVEGIVRKLASRLDLPASTPLVGPDPSVNEWDMAVVGYPLWLWVEGDATMSSQVSGYGITITLDARRTRTVFAMGDGKSVACARMSPYTRAVNPATSSPTCGYTYSWPSLPTGSYHVTAASSWVVDWTAMGYSGSIPIAVTGERDLPVGELHSLNVAR